MFKGGLEYRKILNSTLPIMVTSLFVAGASILFSQKSSSAARLAKGSVRRDLAVGVEQRSSHVAYVLDSFVEI